ncbi:unnamed protein product [Caenorhabditis bovis]|uniref:Nose resistant-to-fluoxetine protein N-terminal domain-containing protein n=1 Tax=Caenorhabditis bovis TaxID=2654633 RepID=A0A8S1E9J2_9PELO|nr:unnamed protein product [Caenorhabditis bovis]
MKSLEKLTSDVLECYYANNCSVEQWEVIKDNLFAIEQIDAFAKFPSADILRLKTIYDGSYEECKASSGAHYKTNYCYLILSMGKNIKLAICVPKSCGREDITRMFNKISQIPLIACDAYCTDYAIEKDSTFWALNAFLGITIAIVLISTITCIRHFLIIPEYLNAFSLWTNSNKLLIVRDHKNGVIQSLDCIRFFSLSWVIAGHCTTIFGFSDTILPIADVPKNLLNHLIIGGTFAVDTITPPMIMTIWFFIVYAPYIRGPAAAVAMNQHLMEAETCRRKWWKNLLYINNFGNLMDLCYAPSWYMSVDTQLYFVAPIFIIALSISRKFGCILLGTIGVISIAIVHILFATYDLPVDVIGKGDFLKFFVKIYIKPWIRCPPYLIGVFVGYVLARIQPQRITKRIPLIVLGWSVAVSIALTCIFITYQYDKGEQNWSAFTRATYYNLSRIFWSMSVAWVIVANSIGWGGPIKNFMSHPIWQPFGRLSYCAYIVHWMVILYFVNIGDRPLHLVSLWQVYVYYAIPVTVLTFLLAFILSCLYEMPTSRLESIFWKNIESAETKARFEWAVENQRKNLYYNRDVFYINKL